MRKFQIESEAEFEPEMLILIPYALRAGDLGAIAGDWLFAQRLADLFPGQVTLRSAGTNSVGSLLVWADRVREDDPSKAVLIYFPEERERDFNAFGAEASFVVRATTPTRATVIKLRDFDDWQKELVVDGSTVKVQSSAAQHTRRGSVWPY